MKTATILIGVLVALALFIIVPYFTYLAIHEVLSDDSFDVGSWIATLWLIIIFGGAAAASK